MTKQETYISFIDGELKSGIVKRETVLAKFVKKWQVSPRTFDRAWKIAQERHTEYLNKLNKEKEALTTEAEKEAVKSAVLTKSQRMEIASNIALGKARKIGGEIIIPSDGDRLRALDYLAKVEGDYAPTKSQVDLNLGMDEIIIE